MDGFLINGEREVPGEGKDGQIVKKQKTTGLGSYAF